jgi:(p)ppGpp synthase/HD superfamily hydrolase
VTVNIRQNIATFHLTMEIATMQQLSRILSKLENIASVVEAHRRSVH